MMIEIGGYIGFEKYCGRMLHEDGVKLNLARNAFAYLIESKSIKSILFPIFMCDSLDDILKNYNLKVRYYSVDMDLKPKEIDRNNGEYLYVVNYYGQLTNDYILSLGENLIVDNTQSYFSKPLDPVDTIYSCRKYFGVSDGAILFSNSVLNRELPVDKSFERMGHILGRLENLASDFYPKYVENENSFKNEPIKNMSILTNNLLHSFNYERIESIRTSNFSYLHSKLCFINQLDLCVPNGAFMYPLYIDNAQELRMKLLNKRIYIPKLWPNVTNKCQEYETDYKLANNILPLPIDQRYTKEDMDIILNAIL